MYCSSGATCYPRKGPTCSFENCREFTLLWIKRTLTTERPGMGLKPFLHLRLAPGKGAHLHRLQKESTKNTRKTLAFIRASTSSASLKLCIDRLRSSSWPKSHTSRKPRARAPCASSNLASKNLRSQPWALSMGP